MMNTQQCDISLGINVTLLLEEKSFTLALESAQYVCVGVWMCENLVLFIFLEILFLIIKKYLLSVESKIAKIIWMYTVYSCWESKF